MNAQKLVSAHPSLTPVTEEKETAWVNPYFLPFAKVDALSQLAVSDADISDAEKRLARFAPFIQKHFPETEATGGIIESPLRPIPAMQNALTQAYGTRIPGKLYLKMDSHLAIAGSVKARGDGKLSMRHLAEVIDLYPSNLKYIEDGVNAPTAEIYTRLIEVLRPKEEIKNKMDHLYMAIRGTPPPDVCALLAANEPLVRALRALDGKSLSEEELRKIAKVLNGVKSKEKNGRN